jgi:uncharacterized membrane protein
MIQFWWVPVLILTSAISCWMSLRTSDTFWYWAAWVFGSVVQLWPLVSKLSNNIVRDAIIFDCILVVSFGYFLSYFKGQNLTISNWIGFAIIVLGIIIFSR